MPSASPTVALVVVAPDEGDLGRVAQSILLQEAPFTTIDVLTSELTKSCEELVAKLRAAGVERVEPVVCGATPIVDAIQQSVDRATTEYVVFHDGRVLWRPAFLKRLLKCASSGTHLAAVQSELCRVRASAVNGQISLRVVDDGMSKRPQWISAHDVVMDEGPIRSTASLTLTGVARAVLQALQERGRYPDELVWGLEVLQHGAVMRLAAREQPQAEIVVPYLGPFEELLTRASRGSAKTLVLAAQVLVDERARRVAASQEELRNAVFSRTTPEGGLAIPRRLRLALVRRWHLLLARSRSLFLGEKTKR